MGSVPAGGSQFFFRECHRVHTIYFIALGGWLVRQNSNSELFYPMCLNLSFCVVIFIPIILRDSGAESWSMRKSVVEQKMAEK